MRKSILIMIAICIIIIILLLITLKVTKEQENLALETNNTTEQIENIIENPEDFSIQPEYNNVELLDEYSKQNVICNLERYIYAVQRKEYSKIISLLEESYVKKNHINLNNINKELLIISEDESCEVKNIYDFTMKNGSSIFFIYYDILSKTDNAKKGEGRLTLRIDESGTTFSISPYGYLYSEYIDYNSKEVPIVINSEIDFLPNEPITKNEYNNWKIF